MLLERVGVRERDLDLDLEAVRVRVRERLGVCDRDRDRGGMLGRTLDDGLGEDVCEWLGVPVAEGLDVYEPCTS